MKLTVNWFYCCMYMYIIFCCSSRVKENRTYHLKQLTQAWWTSWLNIHPARSRRRRLVDTVSSKHLATDNSGSGTPASGPGRRYSSVHTFRAATRHRKVSDAPARPAFWSVHPKQEVVRWRRTATLNGRRGGAKTRVPPYQWRQTHRQGSQPLEQAKGKSATATWTSSSH
jgi:hypothetical protein